MDISLTFGARPTVEDGDMRIRALTFVGAATLTMALLAAPASADRPSRETSSIVGGQVACGATLLTVTSGSIEESNHLHEKPNGLVQEVFHVKLLGVRLVDDAGSTYRAVGVFNGQFTFDPSIAEENGFGNFTQNINILGQGGLFGTVRERFQLTRSGRVSERSTGSCVLLEEDA
jgi:hypothetical protein